MDERDLERRADLARRLKAARWLAGGIHPNSKGKVGYEVAALSARELAERDPLPENGISANLIGLIERMERPTPPMELRALAEALDLPTDWFTGSRKVPDGALQAATERLEELRRRPTPGVAEVLDVLRQVLPAAVDASRPGSGPEQQGPL